MLYDKRWDKKVKADLFTLEGLIAWAATQPADREYDWKDCAHCFVGEYVKAVTGNDRPSEEIIFGSLFPSIDIYFDVAGERPWTFGAALERAHAALSS